MGARLRTALNRLVGHGSRALACPACRAPPKPHSIATTGTTNWPLAGASDDVWVPREGGEKRERGRRARNPNLTLAHGPRRAHRGERDMVRIWKLSRVRPERRNARHVIRGDVARVHRTLRAMRAAVGQRSAAAAGAAGRGVDAYTASSVRALWEGWGGGSCAALDVLSSRTEAMASAWMWPQTCWCLGGRKTSLSQVASDRRAPPMARARVLPEAESCTCKERAGIERQT
eukprot:scaffold2022_cov387-Prasinococcus_capsulatus_cf.AAC.2